LHMHGDIRPLKGALHVVGTDPKYSGITVIEIPLSIRPSPDWIACFDNPTTWSLGVHKAVVHGDRIVVKANSNRIEEDLKWIYSYIDQANKAYLPLMERKERDKRHQQELIENKENSRQALTERLRQL